MNPPTKTPQGFTLVELMVVCAITAILATAMVSLGADARGAAARTADDVARLEHLRDALAALEGDLRQSTSVSGDSDHLAIATGAGPTVWTVTADHALERRGPDGATRWLDRVAALAWGRAGGVVEVEQRFLAKPGTERGARITTAIAPRSTLDLDAEASR